MDLQLEKLKLIEWLIQLNDTKMLSKLISIKNSTFYNSYIGVGNFFSKMCIRCNQAKKMK